MRIVLLFFFVLAIGSAGGHTVSASETMARASWYGADFHGKTMANGERFDMWDETIAAHKTLPLGTILKLRNPENGNALFVTVQDRGPYTEGRALDLSLAGAYYLGFLEDGIAVLEMEVVAYAP